MSDWKHFYTELVIQVKTYFDEKDLDQDLWYLEKKFLKRKLYKLDPARSRQIRS